jgi:hypothetical protein
VGRRGAEYVRLTGRLGRLSAADLRAVEDSIRVQLGLRDRVAR